MPRVRHLLAAAASATLLALVLVATALAASPTPSVEAGDPRSSGQGPGLVGDPLFAIVVVALIAVAALAATLAWIRLTSRRTS